jgi:hypothetical protein
VILTQLRLWMRAVAGRGAKIGASGDQAPKRADEFVYDAFASHATEPDGPLVREIEALVEGFHSRTDLPAHLASPIQLCVDGRDFVFPRRSRGEPPPTIEPIVRAYLKRSRALLILSGPQSRDHPWINKEIEWWQSDRPDGPIYFALTHGADPADDAANQPPALAARGGGDTAVFFDLRGFYRQWRWLGFLRDTALQRQLRREVGRWKSVRGIREEIAKIVAYLVSDATGHAIAVADLINTYMEMERKARRVRVIKRAAIATVLVAALGAAGETTYAYVEAKDRAAVQTWIDQANVLGQEMGPSLVTALAFAANAVAASDQPAAVEALLRINQKLVPIDRRLNLAGMSRPSEQTEVAALFDHDHYLAFGGRDSILHVVDTATGAPVGSRALAAGRIRAIEYWGEGRQLVIATEHGVRLLAFDPGGPATTFDLVASALESERIGGIAVDQQVGALFAGGLLTANVFELPLATRAAPWTATLLTTIMDPNMRARGLGDVQSSVFGMALRGDHLFVTGIDGIMSVFDRTKRPLEIQWQHSHPSSIFGMAVTADGARIGVVDQKGDISLYETGSPIPRIASVRAPNPASVARMPDARWMYTNPDVPAAVGISFDSTGSVVAATGHDRTVKFLLVDDLSPIGIVVHAAAARGVVFSRARPDAITFGDDGVLNVVSPLERAGDIRLGGVQGFAVTAPPGPLAYWVGRRKKGSEVYAIDPATYPRVDRLGATTETVSDGLAFGPAGIALRQEGSTEIPVFAVDAARWRCPAPTLKHPNESGAPQIVMRLLPGPRAGEVATVARPPGETAPATLRLWDANNCKPTQELAFSGQPSLAAVATGAVAVVDDKTRLRVIAPHSNAPPRQAVFSAEIGATAIAQNGDRFAVTLKSGALCLCEPNAPRRRRGEACYADSASYSCRTLAIASEVHAGVPDHLAISPSGRYLMASFNDAAIAIASAAAGWSFTRLAPAQLRPLQPPFAFSQNEAFAAAPAGDTGIGVIELPQLRSRAILPTPGRVTQIAFLEDGSDRILSVDSGILRFWDWQRATLIQAACRRWPSNVLIETPLAIKSRERICGAH